MVPSSLDGLTDEQLAELEAQQGQPEITTGLVDRLAASPAPAQGFTDQQLDALPALASTPFARERGIALPPEAPAEPEPMTDHELNQLEEENYRRVDYVMPQEEFRQYWTRRKEENNEVGRFIDGVGQGAAAMIGMLPQAATEITDALIGGVTDPINQAQRNIQTGAEIVRKAGINMVQLFDWVGNKANDAATWARRRGLKQQALAKRLEQEGRLTGDELRDANIIAAAASEADAMEPTPVEEEEDFDKAYERYQREKALEQEFAGVTDFQIGASKVSAPAATKEAYQITDEQPAETLSMLGSMVVDPVNLIPAGAGALSKLRVLRRTATLAGAPLRGVQRAADATADLAERAEFGISSRVQDITGLTAKQQAALGAGAAGAAVYADAAGGGGNVTAAVTAIGSVLPGLRYGGAIIRKTGAAAGGAATIIREAGVGGIGTARAEAAADLSRMTAIPERYRKYFTGYVDGTDSTLKRVAQDAGNPEALRRVARFADRAGVTTAARLADDVTSGAVAAGITGAPFAALQPDAERAGEVLGGIMALGGVAGVAGSVARRGATEADADIARMMADVYAVGGNVDAFSALPHASLDRMAAMQGVLAGKVDFVPLKADEYRMNKDVSATGGELAAGLFLEKDANGRARVFINLDARKSAGGVDAIAPHEIGHAILTSNVLDGQPRNDLRNLVNQQYGPDGVTARGREYVGRLVDADINNGTTGELPQVLTEQEFRDLESGNKSAADISKARKLEPSERERLINERYEELSQRSIERGEDALDWARDEIIAETFASEAPAIDFRAIRRDAAFPRLAESMLATGGRVLEMMGVRLDSGTGKIMDNPSVLFRDNPLFQDRIMQKRVKEYVRAYDQYLVGLEEAGSATPRGVELARSNRPEDMARSTHVKLRDEGRGVLENDFLFQKPDGTYAYKPQPIINAAEANRAAQIKTLYDAKKFVPVNSTEFGKRKVNGREVIGGPVLPPQFDLFTQFPQHVRQFARGMEASRAEGGSWNIDYNAIGTGSSGRYRITNMGAVRAIQRETVPFGWQVTKQNHLLAASLDLNAFRASAMKAINKGELGIFNNDMKQVEADLKTYLANHRNGMPGEAAIGQQKRDTLNGLIGTGTAVQRAANPLYAELNPKGSIRTWRIDRLNDARPSGRTGYFFDYDKINNNRMPQQIPREAQGMPDVAPRAQMMADDVNADAVGLRSAKFLEQAVGDGMENLRAKQAKREGTGVAKNKFVRFHDNQGRPIYIGAIKKDGGKSFAGWIEETEAWQSPEETAAYRQWYRELKGYFTEIFGERAGEMMMAWLAAQQNVSPGGALGNVFKVEDRLAGIGTGKKGGLADAKIEGVLRGEVPEGGFGPKLTDFVDAGFLREYRTYMAKQPAGGRPFVADVHTGRDSGHVDQQTLTRLKQRSDDGDLFIDGKPTRVKVLDTKTVKQGNKTVIVPERIRVIPEGSKGFDVGVDMRGSPGGPKYEGISEWGNAMTDHLNKIGWRGGEWTPAEVQAVGWMRVLRQYGLPEPTVLSALQQNTSRIYAEVNYSSGNLLPANYPAFDSLSPDAQRAITMDVVTQTVNELAPIIGGSLRVQRVSAGTGAWGNMRSPTTVIEALGSAEATDLFGLALATASEQAATMSATFGVGGKNSRALSFKKKSGEKFTDAEMQSIIDDAGVSGYTMQQLPGGDTGLIADATKDFKPKGLTEARASQVLKRLLAWADSSGIDIEVRDVSARVTSYGNNWKNNTDGQAYLSEIVRRGGAARVRDIVRFRGRYAEILREAYQRHAPETVVPDAQEQVGPIRQAAESPPLEILEMLRGA
jgi:hypothetical protein